MEGGFKLRLPEISEYGTDPDCKIAQLRWVRGHLIPGYIGITGEEKTLLFEALCSVLGQDNVYYVSKEEGNGNPTRYVSCFSDTKRSRIEICKLKSSIHQ